MMRADGRRTRTLVESNSDQQPGQPVEGEAEDRLIGGARRQVDGDVLLNSTTGAASLRRRGRRVSNWAVRQEERLGITRRSHHSSQ